MLSPPSRIGGLTDEGGSPVKTVFGLFETYEAARAAVDELQEAGAEISEMNAIVKSRVAKTAMDIDLRAAGVAVTDEVGEQTLKGLDRLVGGEQPVNLPGLGNIYAAGEIATFIAKAALRRREGDQGLEPALREFDVPADDASTFFAGIEGANWLIFVRTDDDKARQLLPVMRKHTEAVSAVNG